MKLQFQLFYEAVAKRDNDLFKNLITNYENNISVALQQNYNLGWDFVEKFIYHSDSIISQLFIISNNSEALEKYYDKENKIIKMSTLGGVLKEGDDLNKLVVYIEKIVNYQLKINKEFIVFDHMFWSSMMLFGFFEV